MLKREAFPVAKIYVPLERRKTLDRSKVDAIAASMLEKGEVSSILSNGRTGHARRLDP